MVGMMTHQTMTTLQALLPSINQYLAEQGWPVWKSWVGHGDSHCTYRERCLFGREGRFGDIREYHFIVLPNKLQLEVRDINPERPERTIRGFHYFDFCDPHMYQQIWDILQSYASIPISGPSTSAWCGE